MGHPISPNTVGKLLREELGYSRQTNRKTLEPRPHPSPGSPPVSPTGRGHGEALTPPETRETDHDTADQPVRPWLPSKNPDYRTLR